MTFCQIVEQMEINNMLRMESKKTISQRPNDLLRHNTEYNGLLYKYDLPTQNTAIILRNKNSMVASEETDILTPTENLLNGLEVD